MGYEVAEQLGWRAPDCIVYPAASGLSFTRIWKGLVELSMLGLLESVNTHMYVAQAAGSSPIINALAAGSLHVHPVQPETIVKSIAIGSPADGYYALRVARQTGGGGSAVSDDEAIAGMRILAETEGIFTEAAGGVVIGALKKLSEAGTIKRSQLTVALITAAGPRTQEILSGIVKPVAVKPTVASVEELLNISA